ncbi:hypothetical protein VTK73DRAFT_3742 [Phialemonium thermophilum]|uniref:ArfGap-domain-containing protein n=1 Tax=Phialemonium thermophilum TaxID=223376 RepID=A0ABR3Y0Z7_9PEZI
MSGSFSKRQQARNEKVLQELVRNVPGNNVCADCNARNPGWASWSLGIFLCMRCAAIHRKLGTHISKVKSLSMDSWSNEQVENMKKVGNIASNKTYNPQNKKPPVPIDADEADSAMERFIRQKYVNKGLVPKGRPNTGGSESDENPPPLPPKPTSRFGFRSSSSIFPLGSKTKKNTLAARDPQSPREPSSPLPQRSKTAHVFGATIQSKDGDDTEKKLAKLRDMGFTDDQRNAIVLKGVNGDLERTIEALVRLGEGDRRAGGGLFAPLDTALQTSRSLTPTNSLSTVPERPLTSSNNPFDLLDKPPAQPQSSQSTGTLQNRNPYISTNPFGTPAQQIGATLEHAFQGLSLAPSQPLFPHHTGGIPLSQPQDPQAPFQQSPTYPVPNPVLHTNYSPFVSNSGQSTSPSQSTYNPFFSSQPLQQQQTLTVNTAVSVQPNFGNNPFTRSPTRIQSPQLTQIPEQSQQNFYSLAFSSQSSQPLQQPQQFYQPHQPPASNNPFLSQPSPSTQQPPRQRPDKASILALYRASQLGGSPFQAQTPTQDTEPAGSGLDHGASPQSSAGGQAYQPHPQPQAQENQRDSQHWQQRQQQQPEETNLAAGTRNPFFSGSSNSAGAVDRSLAQPSFDFYQPRKHNASRDSMMAQGMEWSNGRHSPDAFASLSARDVR